MIKISIPIATPSQNTYQRKHWAVRHRMVGEWEKRIWFAIPHGERKALGATRARVVIRRYSPSVLDTGNFVGGCKPVLDAMVHLGLLVDDSPRWLDDHYEQYPCKRGESHTEIEISPITEG